MSGVAGEGCLELCLPLLLFTSFDSLRSPPPLFFSAILTSQYIFTSAIARLVRFVSAVVDPITVSVQSDTASVPARELRNTTCRHCNCHQQCCHEHQRQALKLLLHGLLHLRNEMKHAQVIQSKCDVKASRKDGDKMGEEESYGERNGFDSGDDKSGLGTRCWGKYLDKLGLRLKEIVC